MMYDLKTLISSYTTIIITLTLAEMDMTVVWYSYWLYMRTYYVHKNEPYEIIYQLFYYLLVITTQCNFK